MNARPSVRARFLRCVLRVSPQRERDAMLLAVPGLSATVAAVLVRMLRNRAARG